MENNQSKTTLVVFLILLVLLVAANFWMVAPFLLSLLMGAILSLLMLPMFRWLQLKRWGKVSAAVLLTVSLVLVLMIPSVLILILSVKQAVTVAQSVAQNHAFDLGVLSERLWSYSFMEHFFDSQAELENQGATWLQEGSQHFSKLAFGVMGQIPELLLQFVLAALACFYFLINGSSFVKWFDHKNPLDEEVRTNLANTFMNTSVSTIWATFAASGAQSVWMFFTFLILGVPAPFLVMGVTFIFSWFPLVGCSPVWLVGAGYLFFNGSITKAILMIVLGLISGIIDNIVRPAVLKGRSHLHPLVGLVAIFGGISAFGIMGVFVGPVLISVLISLFESWPYIANRYGLMRSSQN